MTDPANELYLKAIDQIYQRQMGRPADQEGASHWLYVVRSGSMDLHQIERQIGASTEALAFRNRQGQPASAPVPVTSPAPGSNAGGSGGSGTSNSGSGTPGTGGGTVLVKDNKGVLWAVNFNSGGGGTRRRVDPAQTQSAIAQFGQPITNRNQLPGAQLWKQNERWGDRGDAIILDVRLGFRDAGPYDPAAADAEDDADTPGADNRPAHALIREVLERYGLGGLSDWALNQLVNGRSHEEIMLELRNQPLFKERFKAIDIRRQHGLNPVSPEDILHYEDTARDLMRSSGLPQGFYDDADDFADLIGKGVSLTSVQDRVNETWSRVVNAPPEVRDAWEQIYGGSSDQALAAFIFDPDKSETKLRDMARTAVAGGAMRTFGLGMDPAAAARVAGFDLEDGAVRSGFGKLAQIRAVFSESRGERGGPDLDVMREGVNAAFDAGEGQEAIEQRITTRRNEFGGGGGALLSNQGLTGAGQA